MMKTSPIRLWPAGGPKSNDCQYKFLIETGPNRLRPARGIPNRNWSDPAPAGRGAHNQRISVKFIIETCLIRLRMAGGPKSNDSNEIPCRPGRPCRPGHPGRQGWPVVPGGEHRSGGCHWPLPDVSILLLGAPFVTLPALPKCYFLRPSCGRYSL